jgi:hypothetical protein
VNVLVVAFGAGAFALAGSAQQGPGDPSALWSLAPLATEAPAATGDGDWDGTPIDRFVRRALRAAGVAPNPVADRRTLLRRASFALLGLPPSPDQMARFLADEAPDAFARAVDALLASPQFGEAQARQWLDLARYSDSNGLDENLAFAQAFRYRDWVVRAHNEDQPFDRFGTLQIAGDLLAAEPGVGLDGHIATGFLALGPRMLAEQDKEKLLLDTVDEQVDLVGRTFLGLTLGCARCHDHKFDPISARDYYALAGIFKSTKSFADLDHVSKWYDRELATDAQIAERQARERDLAAAAQALHAAQVAAAQAQRRELLADTGRYLLAGQALLAESLYVEAESSTSTTLRTDRATWGSPDCAVLHSHQAGPQFAEWTIAAPRPGRYQLLVRYAAKEARPMRVLLDGAVVAAAALEAATGDWLPPHQQWHEAAAFELAAGERTLRLEATGQYVPHLDALFLQPAAPAVTGGGDDLAGLLPPVVRQTAIALAARRDTALLEPWTALAAAAAADFAARAGDLRGRGGATAILLGGLLPHDARDLAARYQTLFAAAGAAAEEAAARAPADSGKAPLRLPDSTLEAARALLFEPGGLLAVPAATLRAFLPAATAASLRDLEQARARAAAAVPAKQPPAICVAEGAPVDLPVHLRGSHLTLAEHAVPRGVPSVLHALVPAQPMSAAGSGRRELAQWLFDVRNPLTARVQANRIWQRLFGEGLVRSPSNFGRRGDVPVHRELLDWLARDFVAHGWSQKRLFRRILLSRAWQSSADIRADAAAADPENRLLWRHERRRLQAEAIRDAMLAVAGTLDPTVGGSLLGTEDRAYVTNDQSNDQARYDAPRRSLYLPIVRNAMYDWFAAFDYADPSVHLEQRPTSAVSTQALVLLNAPFVRQQATAFGKRACAAAPDDAARIVFVWQHAYGRAPRTDEVDAAVRWLARARASGTPDEDWRGLCQAVFASNEFVYVD